MNRIELLDLLLPHCEPGHVALMSDGRTRSFIGWVHDVDDCRRAVAAWREGTLGECTFESRTQDGRKYVIRRPHRLGLVPHRDGLVHVFCVDFDAHAGRRSNVGRLADVVEQLGAEPAGRAEPILFSSHGGRGRHAFFRLAEPMDSRAFVAWAREAGFNGAGQPECFPKSDLLSQFWMPNEPNAAGGDRWLSGTSATWTVSPCSAAA